MSDNELSIKIQSRPTNTITVEDTPKAESVFNELLPKPRDKITAVINHMKTKYPPPDYFEGKTIWKNYLSKIYNQGECGSCWAFASVAALSDRFNIQSLGSLHVNLSPVRPVICDSQGLEEKSIFPSPLSDPVTASKRFQKIVDTFGCSGNTLAEAWRFLFVIGTNEESCLPVDILTMNAKTLPSCIKITSPSYDMCYDYYINFNNGIEYGTPAKFYSANRIYTVAATKKYGGTEHCIRSDIYKFGPISTAFIVYENFYTFDPRKMIYKWDRKGKKLSGHAVVIDGWGEDNGTPFWWVRNSWGKEWGIDGYFKMARGIDECGIESNVVVGLPDFGFNPYFSVFGNQKTKYSNLPQLPEDIAQKFLVTNTRDFVGGLDENEDYSRRILSYKKYYPLVASDDNIVIHEIDPLNFIAGKVSEKIKSTKTAPKLSKEEAITSGKSDKSGKSIKVIKAGKSSKILIVIIVVLICICFLLIYAG